MVETTVKLQEPASYELWPIIVLGIIVVGSLIFFIVFNAIKANKNRTREVKQAQPQQFYSLNDIKMQYINQLNLVEYNLLNNAISIKGAYQRMSVIVREFVFRVTGVKVHNLTLMEIRGLGIPMLTQLIEEFYFPEFSSENTQINDMYNQDIGVGKTINDARTSLYRTKRIIEIWN